MVVAAPQGRATAKGRDFFITLNCGGMAAGETPQTGDGLTMRSPGATR
jgi:hypothetical protein